MNVFWLRVTTFIICLRRKKGRKGKGTNLVGCHCNCADSNACWYSIKQKFEKECEVVLYTVLEFCVWGRRMFEKGNEEGKRDSTFGLGFPRLDYTKDRKWL